MSRSAAGDETPGSPRPEHGGLSCIVAVKDGARFLDGCLRSIIGQSDPPDEVIVVDGGSTDGSRDVARRFPEVRLVGQPRPGIGAAWNAGIAAAEGELLAFQSCDDLWHRDKLRLQVAALAERPDAAYAICRLRFFLEPGCRPPAGFRRELLDGDHVGRVMETLLARRSAFDEVGPFDEGLGTAEDVDWFARALDRGAASIVVPRVLVRKRVHDANLSQDAARNTPNLLEVVRRSLQRKRAAGRRPAVP